MKKIFLITTISLGTASCSKTEKSTAEFFKTSAAKDEITLTDLQIKNAEIQTSSLENKDLANIITLNGFIQVPPNAIASVSAPSGGYVKISKFLIGNHIKEGDILTVLEDPNILQLQQDYLLAKSNLAYAQRNYDRQKDLSRNQASSGKVMQMAQTDAQNQQIMVNSIADRLRILGINPDQLNADNIQKNVVVRAPISGYISAVYINIGQYVSPADKLFDIVNTNKVQLTLRVFEKDLPKIQVGQKVYAYSNQNPDKKLIANVSLIGKNFETDRSVLVYCQFVSNSDNLIPGTYMNAEIETNTVTSSSLPDDAVITWENQQFVFEEVKPKTFKMVKVQIGNTEGGYTEIISPTPELMKKKLVTKGAYTLLMGLKNEKE